MANDTYPRGYRNDPYGRGGTGDSAPSTDPLTELARLIGQSDPFADVNRGRAPAPQPHDTARHDDRYGEQSDQQHYDDQGYAADGYPAPHGDAPADGYAHDPHYDAQHYADPRAADGAGAFGVHPQDRGSGEYDYGDDQDGYGDAAPPRRRGWVMTTVAMIGLAAIGTAGAFAYRAVFTGGPPALISRAPGPDKILPTQNADSSAPKNLDRLATGAADEKFVSHEEQPIALSDPARNAPATVTVQPSGFAAAPSAVPMPADSASVPAGPGPRKVQTTRIKPDLQPVDTPSSSPPPVRVAPAPRAQAQPVPRNTDTASSGGPLSLSPQGFANAQPAQPMRTTALAPPAPIASGGASESAGGSGYFVQVSAQKSHEEAETSFRSIQSKYASVLSGRQLVVRKKDVAGKGVFYGAQIGPLSHQDAVQLCESLKSAGGPCMLQHN